MNSIPRPEYPRPMLVREDNWLNLNGEWEFAFDFGNSGRERKMWSAPSEAYTHKINGTTGESSMWTLSPLACIAERVLFPQSGREWTSASCFISERWIITVRYTSTTKK